MALPLLLAPAGSCRVQFTSMVFSVLAVLLTVPVSAQIGIGSYSWVAPNPTTSSTFPAGLYACVCMCVCVDVYVYVYVDTHVYVNG